MTRAPTGRPTVSEMDPLEQPGVPDAPLTGAGGGVSGRSSLGRATAIMASGTLVSRVLGVVKNAMLVAAIGVNAYAANAYDVANGIPNALYAVLAAGVLNAVLVPQIVRAFQRADGTRTVDRIVTIGLVLSLAVTIVFTVSAGLFVRIYSSGWSAAQVDLATAFGFWVIPQLFFYSAYTILGEVLNSREQYGPYMWAPALNNVIGIIGLGAYLVIFGTHTMAAGDAAPWTGPRIALIAGTATLGIAAQAIVLVWPMVRGGYRPSWVWRGPRGELSVIGSIALWALAAVLVEQVSVAYGTRVASSANPGGLDPSIAGNAANFNALTIFLVPHSLITVSIVTALMTTMSRHHVQGLVDDLRADISRGLRVIATFTFFSSAALIVLAPYAVRLVLPSASPPVVRSVAEVLIAMSVGLVPLGAMVLVKRVYYVLEDAKGIFFIHIPMALAWMGVAFAVQHLAAPRWWTVGVALGLSASNVVGFTLRVGGLRRRLGGLDGRRVVRLHVQAFVGAAVAGFAGWALTLVLPAAAELTGPRGWAIAAGVCALTGLLMSGVYAALLTLMHVEEMKDVVGTVTSRLRRTVR